jgi:hypothetical protein
MVMGELSTVANRRAMVAVLMLMTPGIALAISPDRCSLTPGFHPNGGVVMLATPTGDTIHAGPGDLKQGEGAGHAGNGQRITIFGQRFTIQKIGGPESAGLESATGAVLVPWDYDASCQPVPWARSALWLKSTDTLLLSVRLRDHAHWAGGIPTFDVTGVSQSVYSGLWWQARPTYTSVGADSTTPVNSPAELFEFLSRLPTTAEVLTGDEQVLDAINSWAFDHPEIISRAPAAGRLEGLRRRVRTARFMTQPLPFLGTWRLEIRVRSGGQAVRWLRTASEPFLPWTGPASHSATDASGPDGFKVQFNLALTEPTLPIEFDYHTSSWGWEVASRSPATERHWKFRMKMEEFEPLRDSVPEIATLIGEYVSLWKSRWVEGEEEWLTGEILRLTDDRFVLRIQWDTDGDNKPDLVITGERISAVTAPEPASESKYQRW